MVATVNGESLESAVKNAGKASNHAVASATIPSLHMVAKVAKVRPHRHENAVSESAR